MRNTLGGDAGSRSITLLDDPAGRAPPGATRSHAMAWNSSYLSRGAGAPRQRPAGGRRPKNRSVFLRRIRTGRRRHSSSSSATSAARTLGASTSTTGSSIRSSTTNAWSRCSECGATTSRPNKRFAQNARRYNRADAYPGLLVRITLDATRRVPR
jgi:hypothetical protein